MDPNGLEGKVGPGGGTQLAADQGELPRVGGGDNSRLSLFMPNPETPENLLMRERAGEMEETEGAESARSSANAKDRTDGKRER